MDFSNDPRYQKIIAKLQRNPGNHAVISAMAADEAFADAEVRKKLASMQLAAKKKSVDMQAQQNKDDNALTQERLAFAEQKMNAQNELDQDDLARRKDRMEFGDEQNSLAAKIGIANVGVSALTGYWDWKNKQKEAADIAALRKRFYGGSV